MVWMSVQVEWHGRRASLPTALSRDLLMERSQVDREIAQLKMDRRRVTKFSVVSGCCLRRLDLIGYWGRLVIHLVVVRREMQKAIPPS